jgi:protein-tyrosine phosphatase
MAGSFKVEWLPGGVLLQTRTGSLTVEQAEQYVAAAKLAIAKAPSRWGAVVDTRGAPAQSEEVQELIQGLIKFVVANKVVRIAMVSTSVITTMQQRRVTTAPGMHDPSTVSFHQDLDEAVAHVRSAVAQ